MKKVNWKINFHVLELYGSTFVEKDKWKLDKWILHHDNAEQLKKMIVKKRKMT
jgi:Mlc titration factor MtfA (ptsG expression regulator)